jgi:hypothetical protein
MQCNLATRGHLDATYHRMITDSQACITSEEYQTYILVLYLSIQMASSVPLNEGLSALDAWMEYYTITHLWLSADSCRPAHCQKLVKGRSECLCCKDIDCSCRLCTVCNVCLFCQSVMRAASPHVGDRPKTAIQSLSVLKWFPPLPQIKPPV